MSKVECKEVIVSTLTTRGNGVDVPVRRITQVFEKDGTLIAEDDPIGKDAYLVINNITKCIDGAFYNEAKAKNFMGSPNNHFIKKISIL